MASRNGAPTEKRLRPAEYRPMQAWSGDVSKTNCTPIMYGGDPVSDTLRIERWVASKQQAASRISEMTGSTAEYSPQY